MKYQPSAWAILIASAALTACGGSSSSDNGSPTPSSHPEVPAIGPASLTTHEEAARYVAVTSGLLAGGNYEPVEEDRDFSGQDVTLDCSESGTMERSHGNKQVDTPFGTGDFEYQEIINDNCHNSFAGESVESNGKTEAGYSSDVGAQNDAVVYSIQGDLDTGAPIFGETSSGGASSKSEALGQLFECLECGGANTYKVEQYSETFISDGQYAYRFQLGESLEKPLEYTETVVEYRVQDDDDYLFDLDITGAIGLNSSVCELGYATWKSTETLRIKESESVDGDGEGFVENTIISGKATINDTIEVAFSNGEATITIGGVPQTYDADELWQAGIPCYENG